MAVFEIGDPVLFNPKADPDLAFFTIIAHADGKEGEIWEVVRPLPSENGVRQYLIRSRQDG